MLQTVEISSLIDLPVTDWLTVIRFTLRRFSEAQEQQEDTDNEDDTDQQDDQEVGPEEEGQQNERRDPAADVQHVEEQGLQGKPETWKRDLKIVDSSQTDFACCLRLARHF